jgi:hypothetical protein
MTTTWEKIGTKNLVCVEKFPTVDATTQTRLLITQHLQSNTSTCLSPSPSLLPSLPSLPPPPPFYFAPLSLRSSSLSPLVCFKGLSPNFRIIFNYINYINYIECVRFTVKGPVSYTTNVSRS